MPVRSSLLFVGVLMCAVAVPGQSQVPGASTAAPVVSAPSPAPQANEVVVPVNTTIPLELATAWSPRSASGAGVGIGAAAGALGGLVYVLATGGKELVLKQGTNLELELAAPLSFYRDEIDSSSTDPSGPALGRRDPGPGF